MYSPISRVYALILVHSTMRRLSLIEPFAMFRSTMRKLAFCLDDWTSLCQGPKSNLAEPGITQHSLPYSFSERRSWNSSIVETVRLQHRFSATPKDAAPDLRPRPVRARSYADLDSPASRR